MPPTGTLVLTAAEARVLGALVEKEVTTPDYYPMSMNALMNACNQRSNRDPVMDLDEEAVRQALHGLEDLRLAGRARAADGRVTKYEHWLGEAFNFSRAETALAAVLPRQPGTKESRFAHLLSGNVESAVAAENAFVRRESGSIVGTDSRLEERVAQLEATVAELAQGMTALRQKIDDLFGD
jgi:uncharacterized protein